MQRAALSGLRSLNRSGLSMYSSRGHKSVYINNANCILARMYSDDTKKIKITRTKKVNASPEALNEKIESPTLSEVFGSEDSVPNAKESLQPTWSWIPPRHAGGSSAEDDSEHVIPVIRKYTILKMCSVRILLYIVYSIFRQLLTLKEISDAMKKLGGTDIKEIKLLRKLDTITHCIIVSGSSRRQLRKMADVLVKAVSQQKFCVYFLFVLDPCSTGFVLFIFYLLDCLKSTSTLKLCKMSMF